MGKIKIIFYGRGGIGDLYGFFSLLPDLLKKRNMSIEDVRFYIDSLYVLYNQQLQTEAKAMFSLLLAAGIHKINTIPEKDSSSYVFGCTIPFEEDLVNGVDLKKVEHDFMFWRRPETRDFIRKVLEDNPSATLIDLPITETFFEWKDNKYNKLPEYERTPLVFSPTIAEKKYIDNILKIKHVLIHVRLKGLLEKITDIDKIIDLCSELLITPILIGLNERTILSTPNTSYNLKTTGHFIDLRNNMSHDALMYMVEKAKYIVTSSSGLTFHRTCYKPKETKTIIRVPYRLGTPKGYMYHKDVEDKNNIIFNSDEDNISQILEIIKQDNKDGKMENIQ
jgi:hypothetical protein